MIREPKRIRFSLGHRPPARPSSYLGDSDRKHPLPRPFRRLSETAFNPRSVETTICCSTTRAAMRPRCHGQRRRKARHMDGNAARIRHECGGFNAAAQALQGKRNNS